MDHHGKTVWTGGQGKVPAAAQWRIGYRPRAQRSSALPPVGDREATRPSSISTTRSATAATASSWVTSTMVTPLSSRRAAKRSRTVRTASLSRLPVGSSANRMGGSLASARAMATR